MSEQDVPPEKPSRTQGENPSGEEKRLAKEPDQPRGRRRGPNKPKGPMLDMEHGRRTMKCYPVTGPEKDALKAASTNSSTAFSLAAAFFGYAMDIFVNAMFSNPFTPQDKTTTRELGSALVFFSIILGLYGWKAIRDRKGIWEEIEKSTKIEAFSVKPE